MNFTKKLKKYLSYVVDDKCEVDRILHVEMGGRPHTTRIPKFIKVKSI